ncbi:serine/threonine-protein phosphatase [Massilia sp. RP-1-19]|uniref:Serine/threonine-protein phosphatase n=1 Tax=Massilia polaris TaxID=2728846 RepID=A0A848HFJ9_9BURK|nr:protein phosphatase 2C domain-containing protein [Massilia polaris]NML59742.1 serine/threonine-protein phosphatase [Massilia polaris]
MAERAPIALTWASINAPGMRESNQDAIGDARKGGVACFVVADGAGGHAAGEVAARIAVESVIGNFVAEPVFGAAALQAGVDHANAAVARDKQQSAERQDMSTTLAVLLVGEQAARAVWAHLGDTRIYLFRDGRLLCVSKDHSLTQQLIEAGYASTAQLRTHPQRNILYAALGAGGDTPPVISEEIEVRAGDAFLVCTDGLWEWVVEDDMERSLRAANGPEEWLAALCATAHTHASATPKVRDNYSAYAVMLGAAE